LRSLRTAAAAWPRARAVSGEHKQAWGQVAEVEEHPPSLLRLPLRTARRRSASSLSPRRPGHAKGEGGAFTHPQGPAARSRSREQGAPLFAHVPRSLAPPATSPRRSLLLRFVPADPVAHVAQESRRRVRSPQRTSRLPAKQRAVRFLLRAPASPSRSSSNEIAHRHQYSSRAHRYMRTETTHAGVLFALAHVLIEAWD